MIFIITALPCEAKPFIEHFKLKLITPSPFAIYQNHQIALVVSKVGVLNAISATTYLATYFKANKNDIWLNIGIAGHGNLPKGALAIASKISMKTYPNCFYPYLSFDHSYILAPLLSLDEPSMDYCKESLFDMEGYGFYFAALKFSTIEKIHCLKVISDTPFASYELLTKNEVSELILNQLPAIENLIALLSLNQVQEITHPEMSLFQKHWHFTQTEQHTLRELLNILHRYLPQNCSFDSLKSYPSKKDLFKYLQEQKMGLELL